jgi:hypothetical protein
LSGCGGGDLAGAVVLRDILDEKISLSGGVFLLFSGYFDAIARLYGGRVSEEVVVLPISFIQKKK